MSTLLDTNVVSELRCESPEPTVARWVSHRLLEDPFLSAVSEAELRCGAAILPLGRHRETLFFKVEAMLADAFEDPLAPQRHVIAWLGCSAASTGAPRSPNVATYSD